MSDAHVSTSSIFFFSWFRCCFNFFPSYFSYFSCSVHTQHNVVEIITFKFAFGVAVRLRRRRCFLAVFATGVLLVNKIDILSIKFHKRRDIYTHARRRLTRGCGGKLCKNYSFMSCRLILLFLQVSSFHFSPISNVLAFAEMTMVGRKSFFGEIFQNR